MPIYRGGQPIAAEQLASLMVEKRKITIGLPSPQGHDKRFPLTPEAAGMLVERGFAVKIQQGAANSIHYTDLRYQQHGVEIVTREETLRCDLVISLSTLTAVEARMLKRGALLLSLFDSVAVSPQAIALLLRNNVIAIALDLIADELGNKPFADIIAEISGRAAVAIASSLLADADHGKGILLGGVAGIVPCEVTIIGSGIDACAAARSAVGLGAMVRMFDNDVYRLRAAMRELGPGVMGSALHPRVLLNALRTADVVIATDINPKHVMGLDIVNEMKSGVVAFDLTSSLQPVFPSLQQIDLGQANSKSATLIDNQRVCYVQPGNAVPRTIAMAMGNTMLTMLREIFNYDGLNNALMLNKGLQRAALTFLGRPVNAEIASIMGLRHIDINLILQFS